MLHYIRWQVNFLFSFKLESKEKTINAAVCLRSKFYALLYNNYEELVKLKGTPSSSFQKNGIIFDAYKRCLFGEKKEKTAYHRIVSKQHKVSKRLQHKSNFSSAFDDKRKS